MTKRAARTPLELAAREICRQHQLPEEARIDGMAMWQAHLGEAMAILRAALPDDDFRRLVLDHPWPGPAPAGCQESASGSQT